MTSAVLPEFLLHLLEKEVSNVVLKVVKFVCDEYSIPFSDVSAKIGKHMSIEFEVDTKSTYKVVKKRVKPIKSTPENQCIANIMCKDQKDIRQCTIRQVNGCRFCTKHKAANEQNRLHYGTIHAPIRPSR